MSGPAIRPDPEGARLKVHVSPGSRRSAITGLHGDALKLRIAQPPEKGRANREVQGLLAEALAIRERDVTVVRGVRARDKEVVVHGLDAETLRARITRILVTLGAQ